MCCRQGRGLSRKPETVAWSVFRRDRDDPNRAAQQESLSFRVLVEMFMPRNLVKSVVEFQLLPLILFALLVGAAGTRLSEGHREGMAAVLQVVMEVMTEIVHYALKLAPYGVAALVGSVVIVAGAQVLRPLLWFVVGVSGVLALHLFGSMSLFLKLFSRRSPRVFFRAVRSVLITAFSTSSSNATLPTSIQVSQEVLKVSPSTAGFVLPLGATMNMSGTALYEGCVVLFVAQVYGVDLSLGSQLTLLILAVLSAVAVAGIPGVAAGVGGVAGEFESAGGRHRVDTGLRPVAGHGANGGERRRGSGDGLYRGRTDGWGWGRW